MNTTQLEQAILDTTQPRTFERQFLQLSVEWLFSHYEGDELTHHLELLLERQLK